MFILFIILSLNNYFRLGPWIVTVTDEEGSNDRVADEASKKASSERRSGDAKPYKENYNFKRDNALAVDGITKEALESIDGVISVEPDFIRYASTVWGIDRLDQPNLPL